MTESATSSGRRVHGEAELTKSGARKCRTVERSYEDDFVRRAPGNGVTARAGSRRCCRSSVVLRDDWLSCCSSVRIALSWSRISCSDCTIIIVPILSSMLPPDHAARSRADAAAALLTMIRLSADAVSCRSRGRTRADAAAGESDRAPSRACTRSMSARDPP